ncbi:MAG: hypothetical protein GW886_05710 [Rhodobacterales bacterium]|nr:hypothetical protein [Rhodobacterales bacterium]
MGDFTKIETLGAFHVPQFDIRMDGAEAGARLKWDVLEVTYSDDIDALDQFDFTLADWDPARFEPVYSSPWDASGAVKSYPTALGDRAIPVLTPGTPLSLYLSYQDHGADPSLMLRGKVVSLGTSFPATGVPVARVSVLNPLAGLDKKKIEGNATGGALAVMAEIAGQCDLDFDDAAVPADLRAAESGTDAPVTALSELNPLAHIRALARGLGLTVRLVQGEAGRDVLTLAPEEPVAYHLTWGRTLLSFAPTISTKGLVPAVTVRAQDIAATSADKQKFEVTKSWDDLGGFDRDALGVGLFDRALAETEADPEVMTKLTAAQLANPEQTALNRLREIAAAFITASGQTVGLPALRAGARLRIDGVGAIFSGVYEVTKSTHAIGAGGYTTGFQARKVVVDA